MGQSDPQWQENHPPVPEVPTWARRPKARPGVVAAWLLAVIGLGALWPTWTLVVLVILMALTGAIGVGNESLRDRRLRYGPRRSDVARVALASPWYLVSGVLLTVPGLMVGALAALVIWGLAASRFPHTLVVATAMAVLALLLWWIPSSASARAGTRYLLALVAPGAQVARLWAAAGALLGIVTLVGVFVFNADVSWAPAPTPPVPQF